MKEILREMIDEAERDDNYSLFRYVELLLDKLSLTINCPRDWRDMATEFEEEYRDDPWVYDGLKLWNYAEDEEDDGM